VLDILVAEKELDGPRILLLVSELKAAAMPELMRVHWEPKRSDRSRVGDHLADTGSGQRSLPLGEQYIGRVGGRALQPSQGTHLPGRSGMRAGQAAFETTHVEKSLTAGSLAQAVNFGGSEVLPGPDIGMCVALGKGESRHADLLSTELSCFRWLALQRTGRAT
jgi:hypothetical protein